MRGRAEYACAVNVVEAALVGGLVGGLLVSVLGALVAWRERHRDAAEARDQRAHDLQMRVLEHEHHLQRAALEDAARLRDLRVARLTEEARELARALFDLEQVVVIEHQAFRSFWDKELKEEGLELDWVPVDRLKPTVQTVRVDPTKAEYDIEIPVLTPAFSRSASSGTFGCSFEGGNGVNVMTWLIVSSNVSARKGG